MKKLWERIRDYNKTEAYKEKKLKENHTTEYQIKNYFPHEKTTTIMKYRNVGDKNKEASIQISLCIEKETTSGQIRSSYGSIEIPADKVAWFIKTLSGISN